MNRRSFLAVLIGVPFVGLIPREELLSEILTTRHVDKIWLDDVDEPRALTKEEFEESLKAAFEYQKQPKYIFLDPRQQKMIESWISNGG